MASSHAIRRRALAPLLAAAIAPIGAPGALVPVGPGASESSIRQAVRTPAGRVYLVAADDFGLNDHDGGRLRVYRARGTGIPSGFDEVDAAAAPSSSGASTITA